MNREILQQALDALNIACQKYGDVGNIHTDWGKWDAATTALREELTKPEMPEYFMQAAMYAMASGTGITLNNKCIEPSSIYKEPVKPRSDYRDWEYQDSLDSKTDSKYRIDTPASHIVKWSIPVDQNNFGERLAKPEQEYDHVSDAMSVLADVNADLIQEALDKKADNARELGLNYEQNYGFDRTASHMAGEYMSTKSENVNISDERVQILDKNVHDEIKAKLRNKNG